VEDPEARFFTEKELKNISERDVFNRLGLSYIPMNRRR